MANVAFTSYPFKASPVDANQLARTLPDRLLDVINVKDWGAKGDGVTDDQAAILAALAKARTLTAGSRTGRPVFFPPGVYIIANPPLELFVAETGEIDLWGSGRDATTLKGTNDTGYLVAQTSYGLQKSMGNVHDMTIWNTSQQVGSGALTVFGSDRGQRFSNLHLIGRNGISWYELVFNVSIENCIATSSVPMRPASNGPHVDIVVTSVGGFNTLNGGVGINAPEGRTINCHVYGFDVGFTVCSTAAGVIGCSATRCGIGFGEAIAPDKSLMHGCNGVFMFSCTADRCRTAIQGTAVGAVVHGFVHTGTTGVFDPSTISGIIWSAGQGIVTTLVPHNLPSGTTKLALVTNPVGWTTDLSGDQIVSCLRTGTNTFSYSLPVNPGTSFTSATWNYPMKEGLRAETAQGTTYGQIHWDAPVSDWAVNLSTGQFGPGDMTNHCLECMRGVGGYNVTDVTTRYQPGMVRFTQCGVVGQRPPVAFLSLAGCQTFRAWTYNIVDGATQNTFGGTVTGGGSGHYKIRNDDTNWVRIG